MRREWKTCTTLIPYLAALQAPLCEALAIPSIASLLPRSDFREKNFEYLKVQHETGLNPYYFLAKPALSLPRVSVCLPREFGEPHVDGCNVAFDNIPNLKDKNGNFAVKPGQCRAINAQCCQVTICAPRMLNLLVPSTEVHLQVTKSASHCTDQHLGSIYMDNGWDYLIMVHKPKDLECWPDDAKSKRQLELLSLPMVTEKGAWPISKYPDLVEPEVLREIGDDKEKEKRQLELLSLPMVTGEGDADTDESDVLRVTDGFKPKSKRQLELLSLPMVTEKGAWPPSKYPDLVEPDVLQVTDGAKAKDKRQLELLSLPMATEKGDLEDDSDVLRVTDGYRG